MDSQGTTLWSDAECIEKARDGDAAAFAELWRRHYRAGIRIAHAFTSIDAEDLVSEAFARVYQKIQAGGGPDDAFRPYLYAVIRNLARSWGSAKREVAVDMIEVFPDTPVEDDPASSALDRSLTANAFRALPERWQTVLWYTEVEGMDPHEVAPILGMTPNGVAALAYRAREGLRRAWLQAHVNDATAQGECQWVRSRLGDHSRRGLGKREQSRVDAHLMSCDSCIIVSEEVQAVGSQLAMVLLPLILGGSVGGAVVASLREPGASFTAAIADVAMPPLPDSSQAVTTTDVAGAAALVAAPAGAGLAAAGTGAAASGGLVAGGIAVAGGVAVVAAIGGGMALAPASESNGDESADGATTSSEAAERDDDVLPPEQAGAAPASPVDPADPGLGDGLTSVPIPGESAVPASEGGGDEGGAGGGLVGGLIDDITGDEEAPAGHDAPGGVVGATVDLNLGGTGTPGAHLSLQAAGQVYATTTVKADGTFVLNVTALPEGITGLQLVQTVNEDYLEELAEKKGLLGAVGGLVGGLLGGVEAIIQSLIKPINISTPTGGISIALLTK